MIIRVRSNAGVWRVSVKDDDDKNAARVDDVLRGIAQSRPHVVYETPLSHDPACHRPLDATVPLAAQGIGHGTMIHCRVDPATTIDTTATTTTASIASASDLGVPRLEDASEAAAASGSNNNNSNMRRVIDKDGTIKLVPSHKTNSASDKGFRKGMLALRDMKMHWTREYLFVVFVGMNSKLQNKPLTVCTKKQRYLLQRSLSLWIDPKESLFSTKVVVVVLCACGNEYAQ